MKKYNIINNTLGWLCFVIAAVTYLLTLEPTASFWDCPEFISQGAKLEVGHPPGNPIFMLAARFFVTLFGGIQNAAIAVNSMSALLSAATILLLFWTITHLVKRLIVRDDEDLNHLSWWRYAMIMGAGLCGALAYTWSDTFWFSAVEGEVYAFSSFCTALVFWLILKWESRADRPHSDRFLVLIAYIIGVSIAVHLLNLLCIPAIALVMYYRKAAKPNVKGSLLALGVSFVAVALILYGLVPGFMEVAGWFELFCANVLGLPYNIGVLIYAVLLVCCFIWGLYEVHAQRSAILIKVSFALSIVMSGMVLISSSVTMAVLVTLALVLYLFAFCKEVPVRVFNVILTSVFVIFIGYSSYALLLIRASADTPMNQNAPDNVFDLASYMSREQYGERPLIYGNTFAEKLDMVDAGDGMLLVPLDRSGNPALNSRITYQPDENGNYYTTESYSYVKGVRPGDQPYVQAKANKKTTANPAFNMLFPRMYSTDHIAGYKQWSGYQPVSNQARTQMLEQSEEYAGQRYIPSTMAFQYIDGIENVEAIDVDFDYDGKPITIEGPVPVLKPSFMDNLSFFVNYQLNHMYWRYFMWNFAGRQNDIQGEGEPTQGNWISGIPFIDNARLGDQSKLPAELGEENAGHNVFYMMPLLLGLLGLLWQALSRRHFNDRRGIEQFWVVFFLFFMTGIAIVIYLNQTPGQPRERDYAFAGSFYAFAIWIGLGVPALGTWLRVLLSRLTVKRVAKGKQAQPSQAPIMVSGIVAVAIGILVPLQMVSQTWDDHDRSGRYAARDFGYNYLSSLDDNAIIFTNGDNDTFPLWYAQEVEGYRTDVKVVNLSYLSTDWYANQIQLPTYKAKGVPMRGKAADYAYGRMEALQTTSELVDKVMSATTMLKDIYGQKGRSPYIPAGAAQIRFNGDYAAKRWGATEGMSEPTVDTRVLYFHELMALDIINSSFEHGHKRPVYFATTVPSSYYLGLDNYMHNTGMAYEVTPYASTTYDGNRQGINLDKVYLNVLGKFKWGGLNAKRKPYLDETVRRMVASTRSVVMRSVEEMMERGAEQAPANVRKFAKKANMTYYDMARDVLNTLDRNMPATAQPYDGTMGLDLASMYFDLWLSTGNKADLAAAKRLAGPEIERWGKWTSFAHSLRKDKFKNADGTTRNASTFLAYAAGLNSHIALAEKMVAQGKPLSEVRQALKLSQSPSERVYVYAELMLRNSKMKDLVELIEENVDAIDSEYADIYLIAKAFNDNGIEPMKEIRSLAKKYDFNLDRFYEQ